VHAVVLKQIISGICGTCGGCDIVALAVAPAAPLPAVGAGDLSAAGTACSPQVAAA